MTETLNGRRERAKTRPSARSPWIASEGACAPRIVSGSATLRLDSNEGRPFASSLLEIERTLSGGLPESEPGRYPATDGLERKIAERWGVDPARIVVTAGGDDAISRIIASRLAPASKALVFEPASSTFSAFARTRGSASVGLPWKDAESFPLERAVDLLRNCPALGLVCLASPSSPLGLCVSGSDVSILARECAANGTAFLFDASYGEFCDVDPSMDLASGRIAPAYIVRSFSKAYGLAGMRIGYAIAPDADEAACLRRAGPPYPVSGLAIAAATAALADTVGLAAAVGRVRLERRALRREIAACGLGACEGAPESQSNFAFFRTGDSSALARAFAGLGIAIRVFPGAGGLEDAVRISCPGDEADFLRLLAAVRKIGKSYD